MINLHKEEQKWLEIHVNIGRPEEFLSTKWNNRRLWSRTIPVSTPVVPPRSSSVHLERLDRVDRLVDDEEPDVESMSLNRNQPHEKTCQF